MLDERIGVIDQTLLYSFQHIMQINTMYILQIMKIRAFNFYKLCRVGCKISNTAWCRYLTEDIEYRCISLTDETLLPDEFLLNDDDLTFLLLRVKLSLERVIDR